MSKTGIYYIVDRDGKWQTIDIADMTIDELKATGADFLAKCLKLICSRIVEQ